MQNAEFKMQNGEGHESDKFAQSFQPGKEVVRGRERTKDRARPPQVTDFTREPVRTLDFSRDYELSAVLLPVLQPCWCAGAYCARRGWCCASKSTDTSFPSDGPRASIFASRSITLSTQGFWTWPRFKDCE